MNIVKPSYKIISEIDGEEMLKKLELAGRICYKSEDYITDDSAKKFIARLLGYGHESVLEHEKISVIITCDRGVTHEIVRHRIASYSQESTRYCNYTKDKFDNQLTFIEPFFFEEGSEQYNLWVQSMKEIEKNYFKMIELGVKPEEARTILPNSLKTEIVVTMNLRQWRHYFKLRTHKTAHPQIREVSIPLLEELKKLIPVIFDDIEVE